MKNKKLTALLTAALTACAAFPVSAAMKLPTTEENYPDISDSCVNLIATKNEIDSEDFGNSGIIRYDVDIVNNTEGFNSAKLDLVFDERLTLVPNEDDEYVTPGDALSSGTVKSAYNPEDHAVSLTYNADKDYVGDGVLFSVYVKLPFDELREFNTYMLAAEVEQFANTSGAVKYHVCNGSITSRGVHDDFNFLKGDVQLRHSIGQSDAQYVLREYVTTLAGKPSLFYDDQRMLADIDEDGKVDILDAQLLLKYVTELNTAGNQITWEQLLGKTPRYPSYHISNETYNKWFQQYYK